MPLATIIILLFLLIGLLMIVYCFFPGAAGNNFTLVINFGRIIGLIIGLIVLYIVYLILSYIVAGLPIAHS